MKKTSFRLSLKVRTLDSNSFPCQNRSIYVTIEKYFEILSTDTRLFFLHLLGIHHKFKHLRTSSYVIGAEITHGYVAIFSIFTAHSMIEYATIRERREEFRLPISVSLIFEPVCGVIIWIKWYFASLDDDSECLGSRDLVSWTSCLVGSRDK